MTRPHKTSWEVWKRACMRDLRGNTTQANARCYKSAEPPTALAPLVALFHYRLGVTGFGVLL